MNKLIEESGLTRLQWLRKTYIYHMKVGDDKQADFYRKLADEQWQTQFPFRGLHE